MTESPAPQPLPVEGQRHPCWMCHGWGVLDRRDTGVTAWSDGTGGPNGKRWPVYSLHAAIATHEGDLIECPYCKAKYAPPTPSVESEGEANA
jgi:hypothetical protein